MSETQHLRAAIKLLLAAVEPAWQRSENTTCRLLEAALFHISAAQRTAKP